MGPLNSAAHPLSTAGYPPKGGWFDSEGRKVKIKWLASWPDEVNYRRLHPTIYGICQVNNVYKSGKQNGRGLHWVAYDAPQAVMQFYDGYSGDLLYAEGISTIEEGNREDIVVLFRRRLLFRRRSAQHQRGPYPRRGLFRPALHRQDRRRRVAVRDHDRAGQGRSGGQHVVTRRSTDIGKTWSPAVDVEPSNGPEASYAVLLKVPSGRVYVFYNHNTDNVRQVIADNPPTRTGSSAASTAWVTSSSSTPTITAASWSAKRYDIPMRDFEIDRKNPYGGKLKFFWNVGKAFTLGGAGYVPLHKVGGFGEGFFTSVEGVLLRSDNILTERDPEKIRWETLPDGDIGLRTPAGGGPGRRGAELFRPERRVAVLRLPHHRRAFGLFSYSRDGGRTWDLRSICATPMAV